ncbi:MAG: hypothetical protein Q9169_002812 [Polycauliona sp. 2 TL-2023]
MRQIKGSNARPLSIYLIFLLLQFSLAIFIPSPRPALSRPRPPRTNLTLPIPPDPLVLHRTFSSSPPTTIAIKFYAYGARNDIVQVQHLLGYATLAASIPKAFEPIPRNRPLHYRGKGSTLEMDFNPGKAVTWGQWIAMLDAMKEFIAWYESRDYLFEVRIFERGKMPRGGGAGILWTGLH